MRAYFPSSCFQDGTVQVGKVSVELTPGHQQKHSETRGTCQ